MAEPIPVTNVLSELNGQWNASNVTKPQIVEMNGADAPMRIDLNRADYLIGRPGNPSMEETPLGNWTYVNRTYVVNINLQTRESRQRLYDLMQEVRRICHARRHDMTNFQRIQFLNFNEEIGEQFNVWNGTINIQVVNDNVLAES